MISGVGTNANAGSGVFSFDGQDIVDIIAGSPLVGVIGGLTYPDSPVGIASNISVSFKHRCRPQPVRFL